MQGAEATGRAEEVVGYTFGPFQLNLESLELLKDGVHLSLSPKMFDALVVLVKNRHRVVGKEELFKAVWREAFVADDSLTQCISGLRRALGDDSTEPAFIATVPRRGYRFIAPTTEVSTAPAPASPAVAAQSAPVEADVGLAPILTSTVRPDRSALSGSRWAVAAALVLGLAAGVSAMLLRGEPSRLPLRANLQPPIGTLLRSGAVLSPNGKHSAFIAEDGTGLRRLWLSTLDEDTVRALPGTDGAALPFWSPDSGSLAFFAGGALKKISLPSGPPQTIAQVGVVPAGATWGAGVIAFAAFRSHLNIVADTGGPIRPLTEVDVTAGDRAHEWPEFLPGSRGQFLYAVDSADPTRAGTWLGSLDGREARHLLPALYARFAPPDHLLYVRDRTLIAQPFDVDRGTLGATQIPLAGDIALPTVRNGAVISAAPGLIAFGGGIVGGRLVWLDRTGKVAEETTATDLHSPALLGPRDEAVVEGEGVWLVDLTRGTKTRLVIDGNTPVPSPDGTRVVFNAARANGVNDLYLTSVAGSGRDELLLATGENKLPNDWTRDGRFLVFASRNAQTGRDLWLLPLDGTRQPKPFSTEPGNQIQAQVSPDGRWIAYASNESGSWQVYVQAFPEGGGKRAISPAGGAKPQWRADGRELFYLAPDRTFMAAPVSAAGEVERPRPLFQAPVVADLSTYRSQYAVTPDGQRFLFDAAEPSSAREPVTLLVNWLQRQRP